MAHCQCLKWPASVVTLSFGCRSTLAWSLLSMCFPRLEDPYCREAELKRIQAYKDAQAPQATPAAAKGAKPAKPDSKVTGLLIEATYATPAAPSERGASALQQARPFEHYLPADSPVKGAQPATRGQGAGQHTCSASMRCAPLYGTARVAAGRRLGCSQKSSTLALAAQGGVLSCVALQTAVQPCSGAGMLYTTCRSWLGCLGGQLDGVHPRGDDVCLPAWH